MRRERRCIIVRLVQKHFAGSFIIETDIELVASVFFLQRVLGLQLHNASEVCHMLWMNRKSDGNGKSRMGHRYLKWLEITEEYSPQDPVRETRASRGTCQSRLV